MAKAMKHAPMMALADNIKFEAAGILGAIGQGVAAMIIRHMQAPR